MPDPVAPPVAIDPTSALPAQLAAAGRILLILLGAFPVILKLISTHDFVGLFNYFHTSDGAAVVAGAVAIGTFAWSMFKTFKNHKKASVGEQAVATGAVATSAKV